MSEKVLNEYKLKANKFLMKINIIKRSRFHFVEPFIVKSYTFVDKDKRLDNGKWVDSYFYLHSQANY